MEEFNDLYQNKIDQAKAKLSEESRQAIQNINWKLTVLGMKNYSSDQLDALEIETELLLYGLTKPEDYPYELQNRMGISSEDTKFLVGEMYRLVFQRIETELKSILERKHKFESKQNFLDPRFSTMLLSVQRAISKSNWRSNLYEISQKYKLNIEEMGILEKITVRVIKNEIVGDNYLTELTSNINKTKEELAPLVTDVNEKIIMEIRELLKKEQEITVSSKENENINNSSFDKIPLPPYSKIKSDRGLDIGPLKVKTENKNTADLDIVPKPNPIVNKETKINIPVNIPPHIEIPKKINLDLNIKQDDVLKTELQPKNIIEEKLKGITVSSQSVDTAKNTVPDTGTKRSDPYRESF